MPPILFPFVEETKALTQYFRQVLEDLPLLEKFCEILGGFTFDKRFTFAFVAMTKGFKALPTHPPIEAFRPGAVLDAGQVAKLGSGS